MMRPLAAISFVLAAVAVAPLCADDTPTGWSFKNAKANDAIRRYFSARKKLDEAYEQDRHDSRESLIAKLQAQVKAATIANDLDSALALRDAVKTLQIGQQSASPPVAPADKQAVNAETATSVFLDDLTESESSLDYSLEKHGMMSDGEKQMRAFVHKKQFEHSLFTHPPGDSTRRNRSLAVVTYKIAGAYRSFKASVALVDGSPNGTPVTFCVVGDDRKLWRSKPIISQGAIQKFTLDVRNVQVLTLQVECPGPNSWRQAIWLSPELSRE